ncbi:MAG TPA: DsbE family thiol:disulfide interchange protein [Rhodocyclaceae bacterium]|nr:DsbE family thiol:disulfide interchange protein [Rhodocyclaceae bacterium]
MKAKALVPLALFLVLVAFLAIGLTRDPHEVPSPLIDKPAPDFKLTQLQAPDKSLALKDMKGQVWLLNVWASWCVACREEHSVLLDLAQRKLLPVIGLNYKDQREDGLAWLKASGNPYTISIADSDGRVGIDYGVYGVPESFLIDRTGRIRYKQIGPVTEKVLNEVLIPKIQELQHAS